MAVINLGQRFGGIVGSLAVGGALATSGVGAAFLTVALAYAASGAVIFLAR
jgi:hypothetical protein